MKSIAVVAMAVAACADLTTSEIESNGTSYQGTSYQGTSYQGTSYQGTSYGSVALAGTSLEAWTHRPDTLWEQRLPNRICIWNPTKTSRLSCTTYNLATQASPLAGSRFPATFVADDGSLVAGTIRIGSSSNDVGAISHDTTIAMFPTTGGGGALTYGGECSNPRGCSSNSDLWLYELYVIDSHGTAFNFCPNGEKALALPGTWDKTGEWSGTTSQFTFACTNGTISKCTRWGYRPWLSGTKSDGTHASFAGYHQACVRAATADYCANGHSFTKNGTYIDIYDYEVQWATGGFIPRTKSMYSNVTAFTGESAFDPKGAYEIEFLRYQELSGQTGYGSIDDPTVGCPGVFSMGTAPEPDQLHIPMHRAYDTWTTPQVHIESSPACAHAEQTVGKWLHPTCSPCTRQLWTLYTDQLSCISPSGRWDTTCKNLAAATCGTTYREMAAHSECTTSVAPLGIYNSGCTLAVCSDPAYARCCSTGWSATCVDAANSKCRGGVEGNGGLLSRPVGFCGTALSTVNAL